MFWPDVIALKEFYASPLGFMASRSIALRIHKFWPEIHNESVLAFGFAIPYLSPFGASSARIIVGMPAGQGGIHWPPDAQNVAFLSVESTLPLATNSIDKVIVVHALENSEQARAMMDELWRVLAPSGKIIIVVPNRRGIWARSALSPFAYGRPFSQGQLRSFVSEHSFTPLRCMAALYYPPSTSRLLSKLRFPIESIGSRFFGGFGGVLILEAEKQVYALSGKLHSQRRYTHVPLSQPAYT